MRIAAIETREYRYPLDPPFSAAWDPKPRTHQDATVVVVRSDDGAEGYASGDALPDRALLERLLVGVDATDARAVHGICETVDFHHGRNWTLEVAVWDLVSRSLGLPLWRHLGGDRDRMLAYASSGELVSADERVRRCIALRDAGVRAVKLRLHSDDWRTDLPVIAAVREAVGVDLEIMVDANQGWRMPGDLTPRWNLSTATEFARKLERLDVYWLEEPLPTDDVDGYAALGRETSLRIAAGEMVRTAAEAGALVLRGEVDVVQTDVVLAGGIEGRPHVAALAEEQGRAWSPHTWSNGYGLLANLHAALAFSTCPYLEVPLDPPNWSAERRDWLLPVTLAIADDGTIAAPEDPGLGVVPDWDELEQYRVGVMLIRAAVLHEPGDVRIEDVELDPPKAGEVLVRVAAAGVCHSDVRLADGELGEGRWPMVLGHEGAGVVEAVGEGVTHVAPGDPVGFCIVPSCRECAECRGGRLHLCVPAGENGPRGTLMDGTSRLRLPNGTPLQHALMTACFAERVVVMAASAVPLPRDLPLWQAALLGCGVVTGFGAVRNVARVSPGESVAVVGCGGVGLQVLAAARLAGADPLVAVDLDPAKLDLALGRGATHAVASGSATSAARVRRLTEGGVQHAFEVVGRPETMRLAWDVLRPGGTAVVVGLAARGVEVALPAIEFLSDKGIRGSYYGSGDALTDLPELAKLALSGELDLAGVVTHVEPLDAVEDALQRLRSGEGVRTVLVVDPALAGTKAGAQNLGSGPPV